jgi:hypothetical protein
MNSERKWQPPNRGLLSQEDVSSLADLLSALDGGEQVAALIAALHHALDERRKLALEALSNFEP